MEILRFPNRMLTTPTKLVEFGAEVFSDAAVKEELPKLLKQRNGVGISANQIGVDASVCFIALPDGEPRYMINPTIVEMSKEMNVEEEGCLSLPGISATIDRYDWVRVRYFDGDWKEVEETIEGLLARAVQHELDHLAGKTIINHMPTVVRSIVMAKIRKCVRIERRNAMVAQRDGGRLFRTSR